MTGNGKYEVGAAEQTVARLLLGESLPIRRLRTLIARFARSDVPVLIEGPTGSGKELVAEALHICSGRRGAFVAFNVNALAEGTFESSLFGHVRGAFTGAVHDAPGYLVEAHGGTAFFDEISSLELTAQPKLLRAIETRSFRPIGARSDHKSDFRLVTASNEDLAQLVAEGRFRADLFHRLRTLVIRVPALADHLEDLPMLARHFARRSDREDPVNVSDEAIDRLMRHVWSGNVRELRNVVVFAATLTDGNTVGVAEVSTALDVRGAVAPPDDRAWTRDHVISILADCTGDIGRVAERLGLHPSNVYRLMRRLGVATPKRRRLPLEQYVGDTALPAATG